jgi:hypothetical protein
MTDEERRIIGDYVARVSGAGTGGAPAAGNPQGNPWGGSVPQTQARPPLPPVDPEADAFIGQLLQQYPEARYRLTQTAFVQEAALVEAQNRIRQLEWERDQARSQAQQAQAQPAAPRQGGGFLGGLFGGGQQRPAPGNMPPGYPPQQQGYAPQPQPQYPPGYNPQAFQQPQQQGPSFLGGALRTAAGVAGGMVVGNMLMNAFSHHGQDASAAAGGFGGGQAAGLGGSPWQNPDAVAASQGWDGGGGPKDFGAPDKFAQQPAYQPDATPTSWDGGGGGSYAPDDGSGGGGDGGDYGSSSNDC